MIGEVVLLQDDKSPRQKWKMGIITELMKGRDGEIRSVRLRATQKRKARDGTLPYKPYKTIEDWATKVGEESWMQLEDKTMKWMYGYDDFTKCWEPTRTSDGGNVGGAVPISAILLNNKGWYDHEIVKSQPFNLPLERFKIKPNEDILFRIVNGGVAQELMLYVEGHPMTVVAADGDEVVPMQVDRLIIFPGERYDILIKGLATPTKLSYRIQVETVQRYFFDWTEIPIVYGFGFIEYEQDGLKEDKTTPNLMHPECTQDKKCTVLNCPFQKWTAQPNFTCIAYDNLQNPFPDQIEKEILQASAFNGGFEEHFINMHHDSQMDQYLFQFPWGIPYYHKDDMSSISTITLYNMGLGGAMGTGYAHPFHLHGHHFYVMKVGWPTYNETGFIDQMNPDIDCDGPKVSCNGKKWRNSTWLGGALEGMNTKNPTKRDTITLPVGGYITIRFRAVNPGWWFAHCHLELHLMGGTGYAYRVGEHNEIYMPPDNFPKDCGVFKVNKLPELRLPTDSSTVFPSFTFFTICILLFIDRFF
uniref:Multicopper oxidase n=1 Tax=Caenorhabditis tropicalis TaxID=1561998 RepID=A0A1I7TPH8_9PELO